MAHPNVEEAVAVLRDAPSVIPAHAWSTVAAGLAQPGLYSWWADASGAEALAAGLGHPVAPGIVYAGQTGATKWPSGKAGAATLRSRIGSQHIGGRIRGSTFRFTLGSALCPSLGLDVTGPSTFTPASEGLLRAWIEQHLGVVTYGFQDRDTLKQLESDVLDVLDPPLNLDGRPPTPLRQHLRKLRAATAAGTPCTDS